MQNLLSKEEMEAVINGDYSNIFAVLGIHKNKGSKEVFVRAYQPHSTSVEVLDGSGNSLGMMTKLDERGFYQIELGRTDDFDYKFRITNDQNYTYIAEDVYRFGPTLGDMDIYLLAEGSHLEMYKKLGAHIREMEGVKGVSFAVTRL